MRERDRAYLSEQLRVPLADKYAVVHQAQEEHRDQSGAREKELPRGVLIGVAAVVAVGKRVAGGEHHRDTQNQQHQRDDQHWHVYRACRFIVKEADLFLFRRTLPSLSALARHAGILPDCPGVMTYCHRDLLSSCKHVHRKQYGARA